MGRRGWNMVAGVQLEAKEAKGSQENTRKDKEAQEPHESSWEPYSIPAAAQFQ